MGVGGDGCVEVASLSCLCVRMREEGGVHRRLRGTKVWG